MKIEVFLMSDEELKEILRRSREATEKSKKEFYRAVENVKKAQQRIKNAL